MIDKAEIARIVREVVTEVVRAAEAPAAEEPRVQSQAESATPGRRGPEHRPLRPFQRGEAVDRLIHATPSRILQGRAGVRYLTESYLGLRADHAIALDAVESEVPVDLPQKEGWIALRTQAKDHQDYLLYPDHGRRLDEESKRKLEAEAQKGVDVQIIAGDGLSAYALGLNGPRLVRALVEKLGGAGFRLGRPIFVKFARIGVQDEIGVVTGAKATVIIVGERPGLGTGDSLSIYTAYGPRLGQDNAEKDCISNVRTAGLAPEAAAAKTAELLKKSFAAGGGGVKLV